MESYQRSDRGRMRQGGSGSAQQSFAAHRSMARTFLPTPPLLPIPADVPTPTGHPQCLECMRTRLVAQVGCDGIVYVRDVVRSQLQQRDTSSQWCATISS